MFHVEQFMIPNVKQLLPKLRRNVITSAISLLVPPVKMFHAEQTPHLNSLQNTRKTTQKH